MVANAIQRTVAIDREGTFQDPAAKNWDALTANGYLIYVFDLDDSGIKQAIVRNKNLKQRSAATNAPILGLKNHDYSFGKYWNSLSTGFAAEAAQATRIGQDEVLLNAFGAEVRGFAAGIAGGTAAAPTVDAAHGNNLVKYGWSFFYDLSATDGFFRQYASIADGGGGADTLTMVAGHTLPFTPDPGGADVAYACVHHHPDWDVLEDHTAAGKTSLTTFLKGRHAEDNFESKGVQLTVDMGPIEQGVPAEFKITLLGSNFTHEGISQPALAQAVSGGPGRVVGRGVSTMCHFANAGALLATQNFWGAITITLGVQHDRVTGPNAPEGVHGHGVTEEAHDATMVEVTVPFDDNWSTDFRAETKKHLLIQIGTKLVEDPKFIYFPKLAIEDVVEVSVGGRRGTKITMRAMESDEPITGLTATEAHRARAKFHLGRIG